MEEVIGWLIATLVVGYLIFKFFKNFVKLIIFLVFAIVLSGVIIVKKVYDKVVESGKTEQTQETEPQQDTLKNNVDVIEQDTSKNNFVVIEQVFRDVGENEFYVSNDTTYVYRDIREEINIDEE